MKALAFALFLAAPIAAGWHLRGVHAVSSAADASRQRSLPVQSGPVTRVPVEIISKGSPSQWIYVEVLDSASAPGSR